MDGLRQPPPSILPDKLVPNPRSPFFDREDRQHLLVDRVGWIRRMFDTALAQHAAHAPVRAKVVKLRTKLDQGLEGVSAEGARRRLKEALVALEHVATGSKLHGPVYEDLVPPPASYGRYQNHLYWRERA